MNQVASHRPFSHRNVLTVCLLVLCWVLALLSRLAMSSHAMVTPRASLQSVLDNSRRHSGAPGATAALVLGGRVIWQGESGLARLAPSVAVGPHTLFSLASVTKTYTATLTLRLAERGSLRLDQTVSHWLGGAVPARAGRVTIRQLLMHTSGLPDYLDAGTLDANFADPNHRWTQHELLRAVRAPHGTPGAHYEYSNTNYLLLGLIDSRAGRAPYGRLLQRLVLEPARLRSTFFAPNPAAAERLAHGYSLHGHTRSDTFVGARSVPSDIWGPLWSDGGISATAADVARFADHLFAGSLLTRRTLQSMLVPGPDGSYGMGVYTYTFDHHVYVGHDGAYGGYGAYAFTDRVRRLSLVVLTNGLPDQGGSSPVDAIWSALVRAYDHGAMVR